MLHVVHCALSLILIIVKQVSLHLKQKWDAIHIGLVNNDSAMIFIATVNTTLHLDCVRLLNFKGKFQVNTIKQTDIPF